MNIGKAALAGSAIISSGFLGIASASAQTPPTIRYGSVRAEDAPRELLRHGEPGLVLMEFTIDTEGRVSHCAIVVSSGYDALDAYSCKIWGKRVRYYPARNAQDEPVEGTTTHAIRWDTRPR
ncbi:energy transducer TonB [Stakelama tenebrarum]|uniref:TonB family protein n=1 Tax=Stakelama tenebrarum TaxID=2711215 RepID=A0A6G6Y9J8_9SPHN|nr:TonB family protein [Sphingosinithalassobacter tenebrarum]QIG81614.1 TonB family protein [Sphingosinithalassobacter tenebrarum]